MFLCRKDDIRSQVVPGSYDPTVTCFTSAVFDQFSPIYFYSLAEVVGQLKPTNCGRDVIPSRLLRHTFDIIGPSILTLIEG